MKMSVPVGQAPSWWLLGPGLVWMGLLFVVPLCLMFVISFAGRGTYGGIVWSFSLTNYLDLLHPLYARILGQSILLASVTTLLCLIMGFPLAYHIARAAPSRQGIWLLLVMIPFWTNFLVRTYAWMFILRTEGLLNTLLLKLGVITTPIELLYSNTAVVIGLVYGYLPFMVLPLYVALERVDRTLVEAAWDLYATRWTVFGRIILPLAKPGVVAGCLLVFIPSLGAFLTPDLLGGARSMMIGNLIQHEFLVARDWPLGAAISCLLMLFVVGMMSWSLRAAKSVVQPESES
ncbi:MAG: ABC transporter permease [Nitrospirae bacterium]|nr:ABC transporter permease [Nitrospirota bacterium]